MKEGVLRSAASMGVATFLSRIMGLIREQVFAFLFGAGNVMDAFNVAFRIPNLLRDLFAEGAMSAALVPTFTQIRAQEGEKRAWRVAGLVFRSLFIFVSLLSLLGIYFSPALVHLYARSFEEAPGKFALTVKMTRLLFPFFPLVALAAAFMGILNACGVFFIPAFSSALFNLFSILFGVCLAEVFEHYPVLGFQPIEGMALGVVIGGLAQMLCQLPSLYRVGYRWIPKDKRLEPFWKERALRQMMGMMAPGTLGLAATQLSLLINTLLATSQGPGAVSWLNYAFRLMQFPIGVFGVSLAAATLPKASLYWSNQDPKGVSSTVLHSLKLAFAINLPASVGLIVLSYPIVELLFERGRFYPEDTRATATAVACYSVGLCAYSLVKILVPVCYALRETKTAVFASLSTVLFTITLNFCVVRYLGYWGLALGTSFGAILNCLILLFALEKILKRHHAKFDWYSLSQTFMKYLALSVSMGVVSYGTYRGMNLFLNDALFFNFFPHFGSLSVLIGRGVKLSLLMLEAGGWIILMNSWFDLVEINEMTQVFSRKLRIKLSQKAT